ncbi:amidohydrolase [Longispora fulva]|uniref:L-fuconolactonase n=1 Tax=Longispora fulva TaxID=619741 RepID=A0A8J7GGS2_9ACTN|nr:amidohydrolase family protein [Longispora fulva]MBG6137666.1 L-fuconolactonase [Longispora fulva]GIG62175.1 amidohydrolase [Longispora fulva]
MGRIDAHHHLWDVATRAYPWMDGPWADPLRGRFDPDRLAPLAAAAGVESTIVVQAVSDLAETRELLATAADHPLIAGVVGWLDLTGDVPGQVADLRAGPGGAALVGIRHQAQDESDPRWLVRDDVLAGLRALDGLAYDLLVTPTQLPAAAEVAALLPEVTFVLDHVAKPSIASGAWQPWADRLAALAASPNVTCKLSGLVTEAAWAGWKPGDIFRYVDHALDLFGPDRLMFGSDWPVCTLAATYPQVVGLTETALAGLSDDERRLVFARTARRVYLGGR